MQFIYLIIDLWFGLKLKIDFFLRPRGSSALKVAIFGAGTGGQSIYNRLSQNVVVSAFFDNNQKIHGEYIYGIPVCSPNKALTSEIEVIIVASMYHTSICEQLKELGVPAEKIKTIRYANDTPTLSDQLKKMGIPAKQEPKIPHASIVRYHY